MMRRMSQAPEPLTDLPPWRAENGTPAPRRVVRADDTLSADSAYRLACEGTGLLWQGDFHNARQLLQALARRDDTSSSRQHGTDARELPGRGARNLRLL